MPLADPLQRNLRTSVAIILICHAIGRPASGGKNSWNISSEKDRAEKARKSSLYWAKASWSDVNDS